MRDFFKALRGVNPNAENIVMTAVDGAHLGEKCLISAGTIVWESGSFFSKNAECALTLCDTGSHVLEGETVFCEVLGHEKSVVICGAGHISMSLIALFKMLAFTVIVIDDRPEFADNARRAGANEVYCEPFESALAKIEGDADTFFIVVTRGHRFDELCMAEILQKPHAYIGMIGSRRHVQFVREYVLERGADPAVVDSVHAPIGLAIGSQTPEEIAVSIAAEVIGVKNGGHRTGGYPRDIMRALMGEAARNEPSVLATIVSRRGSSPRDIGTKMLVFPDGRIVGTIGGGALEGGAIVRAKKMLADLDSAPVQMLKVDMTKTAQEDGMVCGGIIDVLLERIEKAEN